MIALLLVLASAETVATRFPPPEGFSRISLETGEFGTFLRDLPLRAPGSPIRFHDGRLKSDQSSHAAILDVSIGSLVQCADAVILLRSRFLRATGRESEICFHFTSGAEVPWLRWKRGERPRVDGRGVRWTWSGDSTGFEAYLTEIFRYAGTYSLEKELTPVELASVHPGDVLVRGGFPGHAALVVDVVESDGERQFLLAQGFMPAQDLHVLRNPEGASPWYSTRVSQVITPDWTFEANQLRRFPAKVCGP